MGSVRVAGALVAGGVERVALPGAGGWVAVCASAAEVPKDMTAAATEASTSRFIWTPQGLSAGRAATGVPGEIRVYRRKDECLLWSKLAFNLEGRKLLGKWGLLRRRIAADRREAWLHLQVGRAIG